jgi:hypothetical protein
MHWQIVAFRGGDTGSRSWYGCESYTLAPMLG